MHLKLPSPLFRVLMAVVIPIVAMLLKFAIGDNLPANTWLLFYPAVFFSAWIGKGLGGAIATFLSAALATYFFITPQFSWAIDDHRQIYSISIFISVGLMFSFVFKLLNHSTAELQRMTALELELNQKRLTQALLGANTGIWEWNLKTNTTYWTDNLWQLFGLEPHSCQASYDAWLFSLHIDDRATAGAALKEAVEKRTEFSLEWRLARLVDGKERWLMTRGQPEFDVQGELVMYRGVVIDISESKRIESELREKEDRLNFALETLDSGAWELNINTMTAYRTLLHDQIFGYSTLLPEWHYQLFLEHVLPEDREHVDHCFQLARLNQSDWRFDCRIRRKDGEIRWITAKGCHRLDKFGQPTILSGIVQDITERKLTEEALSSSEKDFHLLAEAMPQIVWITQADGMNIYFNQQWVEYTGLSLEQSYGEGWIIPFHPEDKQRAWDAWQKTVQNHDEYSLECRLRRADGVYRWWLIRGIPIFSEDGTVLKWFGTYTDIHDLKESEAALRKSEARWQFALEGNDHGVWDWDIPSGHVFYSNRWKTMLGFTDDEIRERIEDWMQHIHPDDLEGALEARNRHWRGEKPFYQHEYRMRNHNGEYQWIFARGMVVSRDKAGQPLRMIGTHCDITEQKQIEAKLKENERLLVESQAIAHIGSWVRYIQTNQVTWSDETYRLMGLMPKIDPPPSFEQFLALIHPDDRYAMQAWHDACLAGKRPPGLEYRVLLANGEERWLLTTGILEMGANSELLRMIGTVQDITKIKRMAAEKQRWADAFHYCAHGIAIGDPNTGRFLTCNPAFAKLLGYTGPEEVEGKPILGNYAPEHHEDVARYIAEADAIGYVNYQKQMCRKDASVFDVQIDLVSVKDAHHNPIYRVATIQDITERKHQEAEILNYRDHLENLVNTRTRQLIKAREHAEQLNQVKSAFLSNMSHEIRTPMNAVLGFCYLLEKRPLDDDSRSLVRKIHSAGRLLLAIINDVLDFSKIEAGRLNIDLAPFRINDLLDHLAALMYSAVGDKNLELVIIPPVDVDALVGDGLRLQQVLVNLLGNAIKFTEQGEVEVRVSVVSQQNDQVKLRFSVRDSGIGISEEHQQGLFSAFTQADNSISRRFGGTGLGLAISRQLVSLMGGELQVKSRVGYGSEFWFELPLKIDSQVERMPSALSNLHVLVVDDSATAREALRLTTHSLGWRVDEADSGEEAIARIQAKSATQSVTYDVLLLDWQMPGMDGLTTAQAIRKTISNEYSKPDRTPIVLMVTAYSRDELSAKPSMINVDALLSKPVTPSSLYKAIAGVLQERIQGRSQLPLNKPESKGQRIVGTRILVVDDSDINREVAKHILEGEGALVSLANDGQEALDWLAEHADKVDIILMDIQMPNMDGYTATRLIRQHSGWPVIPIVALTAGAFKNLEDSAFEAGMNDFIAKPFNVAQLIALIQHWTSCKPDSDVGKLTENTAIAQLPVSDPSHHQQKWPGIDLEEGLKTWQKRDVYQKYLLRFIDEYCKNHGDIVSFVQQGSDHKALAMLVHKMKGAAYSLALGSVAARCVDVETALTGEHSLLHAVTALRQALDEVSGSLSKWLAEEPLQEKTQALDNYDNHRDDIVKLLIQLLAALDEDSPSVAEPLLKKLENQLGSAAVASIQTQLQLFNFREAEVCVQALINQFNLSEKE